MKRAHSPRLPGSRLHSRSASLSGIVRPTPDAPPSAALLPAGLEPLREVARALPRAPGVYLFHGERGGLPLYIGKSVDLRARVLSHLRNAQEARMLRQLRRIDHERTGGEIGALLLEARLIKEQLPLFNQRLRRQQQLCSLRLIDGMPEVVYANRIDFAQEPEVYGLFAGRHAALDYLRELADAHRLCLHLLGLEAPAARGRCFRAMLGRCAGACAGAETEAAHRDRLVASLQAVRVACWPFGGAIGLREDDGEVARIHVVRNWCYLGSAPDLARARALCRVAPGFDADAYRVLCKPILLGSHDLIKL
ncbi:excinuclease Cho [Cupriavidus basilensis]|uniref:excinuclease Cho n=1 Tax=Cupriavidus basilensis TaxID=68895 RepID=UPI00284C9AEB|nr:excinuclease Cho [Cupriavidus basilensis]MDR3381216.1 excinuclease Cho [Cupriavidus basilensis]